VSSSLNSRGCAAVLLVSMLRLSSEWWEIRTYRCMIGLGHVDVNGSWLRKGLGVQPRELYILAYLEVRAVQRGCACWYIAGYVVLGLQ
jgi:hypothetical protein